MEDLDDDFGDLYADVEFQPSSATNCIPWFAKSYVERMEVEGEGGGEDNDVTDSRKFDMVHGDLAQKLMGSEANGGKEMNVDNGSDSEDDLNIVLNDEDCKNFPIASGGSAKNGGVVGGGGHVEDEDDGFVVVGEGSGGSEPSSNGHGGERGNGARGVYNSQYTRYKYMRPHGAAFPSNMRGSGPVGMASYSSMLAIGNRDDSPCNQHKGSNAGQVVPVRATANSVPGQSRNCFWLPWYRTILDVNIDTFEEKPWRFPGVDITDFFNFGFNEDNWKEYCNSLEQFQQQAFMESGIPVCGSLKINQACESKCEYEKGFQDTAVEENQVGLHRIISPSSKFDDCKVRQLEMPKGRAIQVEDSAGERQPSMDVRRSRTRDSDVIQITVQDPIEDSSASGKEEVHHVDSTVDAASENGNSDADDSSDIYCSGNASGDEPSVQSQEGNVRRFDRCYQLRTAYNPMNLDTDKHENEKIPGVNVHQHQKGKVYSSEGVTEGMETVNKTRRGISRNSFSGDPFTEETELSLSDHGQLSLDSSCYGSDSEDSRDTVCADLERTNSPLKRPSLNSSAELLDSVTSYHKNTKSSSVKSKLGDMKLRNKGSTREEQEHCSRRGNGVAKPKIHPEGSDDGSHMWDAEDLGETDHSLVKCSRQKERKQRFERRDTENLPYHREKEFSSCNGGEKFADNGVRTAYRKHPYRKGNQNLRDEMDSYVRKKWDEKEYFNEQKSPRVNDEDRDRDWYHRGGGFSTDYSSRFTYGESRQLNSRYSSCSVEERDAQWSRKHSKLQLRKRTNDDTHWLDYKHEDHFVSGQYGRPASFLDRNLDFLDEKYERKLPYIGRELKNSGRRDRYGDSPPLDLDNPWSREIEDDYRREMDYQSLNSWFYRESYIAEGCQHDTLSPRNDVYDSRLTERYGRRWRQIFAGKVRDNGWLSIHNDGNALEDCMVYPDDQDHLNQRRYSSQSRLHWSEDEYILRHQDDKLYVEEASLSYKKTSGHERICARYGSAHDGRLSDEMQVQQRRLKMIKGGSSTYCFNRSSKIINREKHEQAVLRCRDSVDLVVGEGKPTRRCTKSGSLMSNDRSGNMGQKIDQKRAALMDSNEPHMEKTVQSDVPRTESSQNNAKCLDKFPITEHNEDLDIEEGQIVTEEPSAEDSFRRKGVSQDAALTCNVKRRILSSENGSNVNKVIGGYDNQRILDTLAKMEKRRERFKEPIALKKEPGNSLNPEVDLIVDTDETKQQRPARKRQWGGS